MKKFYISIFCIFNLFALNGEDMNFLINKIEKKQKEIICYYEFQNNSLETVILFNSNLFLSENFYDMENQKLERKKEKIITKNFENIDNYLIELLPGESFSSSIEYTIVKKTGTNSKIPKGKYLSNNGAGKLYFIRDNQEVQLQLIYFVPYEILQDLNFNDKDKVWRNELQTEKVSIKLK